MSRLISDYSASFSFFLSLILVSALAAYPSCDFCWIHPPHCISRERIQPRFDSEELKSNISALFDGFALCLGCFDDCFCPDSKAFVPVKSGEKDI